ncbi:hypothetical protein ACMX2H_01515 [Arthrobacter sulfonylureivorans]|uniref:hypothetical protein n=1 Tax=Arthrobacter sulfonylureivorans TaxID=2486855 RepID=UPI0039E2D6C5
MVALQAPDPVEVVVRNDAPDGWEVLASLGPLAILLAAVIAAFIGWRSIQTQAEASRRAQWWERAEWALDASMSSSLDRRVIGLGVLTLLAESTLAGEEEARILQVASNDSLAQKVTTPEDVEAKPPSARVSGLPEDERVMVEAARLRVVTDRKIGQQTPEWVVELTRTRG